MQLSLVDFNRFLFMMYIWHIVFKKFKMYNSRRFHGKNDEWLDIIKAITVWTVLFGIAVYLFKLHVITIKFIIFFYLLSTVTTILFRFTLRYFLKIIRLKGRNLRHLLIIGTNQRAYDFASIIEERKELGYRLLGFLDDMMHIKNPSIKFIKGLDLFPKIIRENVVDEVIIALPIKSHYEYVKKIIQKAEEHGIVIRYLSDLFATKIANSRLLVYEGFNMMTLSSSPTHKWQYYIKRIFDIVLASIIFILTLPLFIFAAIGIKLTLPGKCFFIQERVGYNKRIFKLYKFRTMCMNADKMQDKLESENEMDGPVFKIQNDPRITPFGMFLRKTSIDELPQLINVIIGNMSLVGPRPLPIRDYSGFSEDWQMRRFSVLPGITCIWQISGRNNIPFKRWMELDMKYIDNWTLLGDFKILCKTISAVLSGRGAS